MAGRQLNVDNVIMDLLATRKCPNSKPKNMNFSIRTIENICHASREVFRSQPMLLRLDAPVKICGDTHGQFEDLLRLFDVAGYPPTHNYLFLGDYVDRGRQSLEVICLLLAYKIKYPVNFFLLRGNHEDESLNYNYGFFDECKKRYCIKLHKTFSDVFNWMPVAGIVGDKIFCTHGGISPSLTSMNQIVRLQRPCRVPQEGIYCDLLWADPDSDVDEWGVNTDRGKSYYFGKKAVKKFLKRFDFDLIARAHNVVADGYLFFAGRRVVTIFSAPNYCERFPNACAIMNVDNNLLCSFEVIKPIHANDNDKSESKSRKMKKKK